METSFIENLALGFSVALSLTNILFALLGALIGTAIGVLPGIGPVATISLLLPITFGQPATTAIIMLAGFAALCIARGWQLMGCICAAICAFSLLLDSFGLMIALIATIFISAAAEPEHRRRPVGVLGVTIFLLALCWWVFIDRLDIRVNVWPQF